MNTEELLRRAEGQAEALRITIKHAYKQANNVGNGAVCLLILHRLIAMAADLEGRIKEIREWSFPAEEVTE